MRISRFLLVMVAVGALAVGCGSDSTGPTNGDVFEWAARVDAGDVVEIKGIVGSINVFPTNGPDVDVRAVKRGGSSAARQAVWFDVIRHGGGVTICAMYPDVPGRAGNACGVGDAGTMNVTDNDVRVTFTVYVPEDVRFRGQNVSGNVIVNDIAGDVAAVTVAGDVIVTTSGEVEVVTVSGNIDVMASGMINATSVSGNVDLLAAGLATATTVSGSIYASLGGRDVDDDLVFSSVSGNVTVRLPWDANAYVYMMTTSGALACDFSLNHTSTTTWEGSLGGGGNELLLWSVSGNVALRQLP